MWLLFNQLISGITIKVHNPTKYAQENPFDFQFIFYGSSGGQTASLEYYSEDKTMLRMILRIIFGLLSSLGGVSTWFLPVLLTNIGSPGHTERVHGTAPPYVKGVPSFQG